MSKVWLYGDHIDTDVIIPARYLNIADFKELAEHAMVPADRIIRAHIEKCPHNRSSLSMRFFHDPSCIWPHLLP